MSSSVSGKPELKTSSFKQNVDLKFQLLHAGLVLSRLLSGPILQQVSVHLDLGQVHVAHHGAVDEVVLDARHVGKLLRLITVVFCSGTWFGLSFCCCGGPEKSLVRPPRRPGAAASLLTGLYSRHVVDIWGS